MAVLASLLLAAVAAETVLVEMVLDRIPVLVALNLLAALEVPVALVTAERAFLGVMEQLSKVVALVVVLVAVLGTAQAAVALDIMGAEVALQAA